MAKGGSLMGKADPTITKMAYAAALGNVPVDNSAALTTMRNTYKSMLDTAGEIYKQIEVDKKAMDQNIQSMISPLLDQLEDGTLTDPAFEDTKAQIQAFSKEAEDILKSKEYRRGDKSAMMDFNRRFSTYVNGISAEKEQLLNLATNIEGKNYNVGATQGQEFQQGILKFYRGDTDSGVTRSFENNKAYYTMNIGGVTVKKSLEEVSDGIIPKDVKMLQATNTLETTIGRNAAQGGNYDELGVVRTIESQLENSTEKIKAIQDFYHTRHRGQKDTLYKGLTSGEGGFGEVTAELFTVLNKNGLLQEYDTNSDGLDKDDFKGKNAAKYLQLVDDITKGKDFDLSKRIAAQLYSNTTGKSEHERLFKAKELKDSETQSIVLSQYRSFYSQDVILNDALKGNTIKDWNGNSYITNDGGKTYKGGPKNETYSVYDLLTGPQFGMQERIARRKLEFNRENIFVPPGKTENKDTLYMQDPNYENVYDLVGDTGITGTFSVFKEIYPGFSFEQVGNSDKIKITAPNSKDSIVVIMNRFGKKRKNKSAKSIIDFINSFNK